MKSFLIICVIVVVVSFHEAKAQAFFTGGFGYGFSAGDRMGVQSPDGIEQNVYDSFGKGLAVGLGTGYMVNRNAGFDFGIWYVMGSTYDFETFDTALGKINDRVSGSTIRIMPSLKVSSEGKNKLYVKFGLVLGIATVLEGDETFSLPPQGTVYSSFRYSGGTSVGWIGALGIDFNENQATSIFVEVNFFHQNYYPEILTQSIPGIPKLTYKLVDEPNPAAGDELLKPSFPFSTIGLSAGVKFSSAGKKKNTVK